MHGAHVPPDVDQELKQEADHVSPVTNAEPPARDQPLKHARAVWPLVSVAWCNSNIGS